MGTIHRSDRVRNQTEHGKPLTVIDKRIEDSHRFVGDTRIGVDLLENWAELVSWQRVIRSTKLVRTFVDIRRVSFLAGLSPLLLLAISGRGSFLASRCLLGNLGIGGLDWGLRATRRVSWWVLQQTYCSADLSSGGGGLVANFGWCHWMCWMGAVGA